MYVNVNHTYKIHCVVLFGDGLDAYGNLCANTCT